jgi:hypothetical protein
MVELTRPPATLGHFLNKHNPPPPLYDEWPIFVSLLSLFHHFERHRTKKGISNPQKPLSHYAGFQEEETRQALQFNALSSVLRRG